jgi:cytochrome c-type biogenesis protein CcmE
MKNGRFEADKILMKCPSKYQEGEVKTEGEKGT